MRSRTLHLTLIWMYHDGNREPESFVHAGIQKYR